MDLILALAAAVGVVDGAEAAAALAGALVARSSMRTRLLRRILSVGPDADLEDMVLDQLGGKKGCLFLDLIPPRV